MNNPIATNTAVNISVAELLRRIQNGEDLLIIDVREPDESAAGHIAGSRLMPLGSVEQAVVAAEIAKDQEIILFCRAGRRSLVAYDKLAAIGYTNLINVEGGMIEWAEIGPVSK